MMNSSYIQSHCVPTGDDTKSNMDKVNDDNLIDSNDQLEQFIIFKDNDLISKVTLDKYECIDYVNRLCSLGVNKLLNETQYLDDEKSSIIQRTTQLTYDNYETIVKSAHLVKDLSVNLSEIDQRLCEFDQTIPKFNEKIKLFTDEAKSISKRWRETSLMLNKHPQLLEFLEILQLIDSCIRNNYYDEALHLLDYINKLNQKHGKNIVIIQKLATESEQCKEIMVNHLIKELYTDIQLPACMKIVAYLRRLEVFNETEIRIKFLIARDTWLQSLIKEIPTSNPHQYLTKLIELNRNNLFDIVTQYKAAFPEDMHNLKPLNPNEFANSSVLFSWLIHKVNIFLSQLTSNLTCCIDKLDIELDNQYSLIMLIDPCFHFGLSLSKVGADFRPQLIRIFIDAIESRFEKMVSLSIKKFERSLDNYSILIGNKTVITSKSHAEDDDLHPPSSLLEFTPLAQLCNNLLGALNEVHKCMPLSSITKLRECLNLHLKKTSEVILRYFKAERLSLKNNEHECLIRFCDQYASYLLPHIQKCIDRLGPESLIAKQLGVSVLEFKKLRKDSKNFSLTQMNLENIIDPIKDLVHKHEALDELNEEDDGINMNVSDQ